MQLATERLLRELTQDDWPVVWAYQADSRYLRYHEWEERPAEHAREFVRMLVALQHDRPRRKFQLGVTLRASGRLIGNRGIRMDAVGAHEADIGYELSSEHWGNGYATQAARAVVAFGFTELHVHRISSWCVADNAGSARVLEKAGMRPEGRLRDKGRWWDRLIFAVLDDEWRAQA